ncbi:MAG: hypothetical protein R2827_00340 [Bdellovibrionales bacterium]
MRSVLLKIATFCVLLASHSAFAGVGFNVGGGLPYTSQFGVNWFISDQFSAEVSFNQLSLSSGTASLSMTKPEIGIKWHMFKGSFFLGLALGQFTLESVGTDPVSSLEAKAEITATAMTVTMGWLWSISDGGFFWGLDFGYQSPSGVDTTITGPLSPGDTAYDDAEELANDMGDTALPLFTFLRLGYMF